MSLDSDHHLDTPVRSLTDEPDSSPHRQPRAGQAPADDLFKRPVYTAPELGRTCDRPGAYDAFDLPSLFDGQRKPYRFADPATF